MVSALRAKVPVLLYDRSPEQVKKGLSLVDKLLAKDVTKGRLTNEQAKESRDRILVVGQEQGIKGLRDVDMVVEVRLSSPLFGRHFSFTLKCRPCQRTSPLNNPYSKNWPWSFGQKPF